MGTPFVNLSFLKFGQIKCYFYKSTHWNIFKRLLRIYFKCKEKSEQNINLFLLDVDLWLGFRLLKLLLEMAQNTEFKVVACTQSLVFLITAICLKDASMLINPLRSVKADKLGIFKGYLWKGNCNFNYRHVTGLHINHQIIN